MGSAQGKLVRGWRFKGAGKLLVRSPKLPRMNKPHYTFCIISDMRKNRPMTETQKTNVESFDLDHTAVKAPYVRVAGRKVIAPGVELIKYDIRFTQPNKAHLEMKAVHSIEHMSAHYMRNHTDSLIDFSPMGCQTGFYALTQGVEPAEFFPILEATMQDILNAQEVPAANEVQCGWGASHSLAQAQAAVGEFLDARQEWEQVMA